MSYFSNMFEKIFLPRNYMLLFIIIFVFSVFHGKIAGWYTVRAINKILSSKYKIVEDLKHELIEKIKLKDKLTEYYNYLIKTYTYLLLFIASLGQLIELLTSNNVDRIVTNVCMLTLIVSFMEFRDNKRLTKIVKDAFDAERSTLVEDFVDLDSIAFQDYVLDKLVKEKRITEEKRLEIIKNRKLVN